MYGLNFILFTFETTLEKPKTQIPNPDRNGILFCKKKIEWIAGK
tara:strand:- start:4175 stop:4306 length:132 start_codon:yes stop_codon:yes gene_type:complete